MWRALVSTRTRSSPFTSVAHGTPTDGRGNSFTLPVPDTRTVRSIGSPTRDAVVSSVAPTRRLPTAPPNDAGRPVIGGSTATMTVLSVSISCVSSRLKKLADNGSAYTSCAGGMAKRPGISGNNAR